MQFTRCSRILRNVAFVILEAKQACRSKDLFSQPFGGSFLGGGGRQAGPRRTKDLVHRVNVSLEDLCKGKTTKLSPTRSVICTKCLEKGGKEGSVRLCLSCDCRGIKIIFHQTGAMIQQMQIACHSCSGSGEVLGEIDPEDRCPNCKGKKVIPDKTTR